MNNNIYAQEKITNLIIPVSYFTNHKKQFEALKANLKNYKNSSLVGLSGMGKSQLARMYSYENKENYNLIWFFDCNLDLTLGFLKLAKVINQKLNTDLPENPELVKKEVMSYLENRSNWLLVFDNLKVGENELVKSLINWDHNGDVIFCSQDKSILPYTVEMKAFNQLDSITLADNMLDEPDSKFSEFLAESFEGYPALIVQGAQLINKIKGLDKKEYKKKIQQSSNKIKANILLVIKELTPSALNLLGKIALINNQSFSKQFLSIITDNKETLSEDIYDLSKFILISNIDSDEDNPVFEMHDIISDNVIEINGTKNNSKYLEDIISKLTQNMPVSFYKSHLVRNMRTIPENLEIISRKASQYNIGIDSLLRLNLHLMSQYIHSLNYYNNAAKIVDWFDDNESKGNFKLWLMNDRERNEYANFLAIIGWYYRTRCADWNKSIEYLTRAKKVLDTVHNYENSKFNTIYQLSVANVALGNRYAAEENILDMEKMNTANLVDKGDIGFMYYAKARLYVIKGNYKEALEMTDKSINYFIGNGVKSDDLAFTNPYLRKAEILNVLGRYDEAYTQSKQLYEMHKLSKKKDHEIFGRIYTHMASAELGKKQLDNAQKHIKEAMEIFLADETRNPKNNQFSSDVDLAYSYIVQADIYSATGNLREAIKFYREAQGIYFNLYKNNMGNIAHVSELYLKGAKAACRAKDLYYYKCFGEPQVKEFGKEHINTITMFEYCKNYNMDLWQEEN